MGAEVIEEGEMEPLFRSALPKLAGKKVAVSDMRRAGREVGRINGFSTFFTPPSIKGSGRIDRAPFVKNVSLWICDSSLLLTSKLKLTILNIG